MQRFRDAFRKATPRDLGVLVVGIVLVVSGVGMSVWIWSGDAAVCSSSVELRHPSTYAPGGERT